MINKYFFSISAKRNCLFGVFCFIVILSINYSWAESTEANSSGNYESLRKEGEVAFAKNNYAVAERCFNAALKEAESSTNKDLCLAQAYKNLAALYDVRGQFAKTEYYLEKELRAREKILGSENPQVINLVGKLANFYLVHGSEAKAEKLTNLLANYSINVLKKEKELDSHFMAISKFYDDHAEYAEARKKLKILQESNNKIRADDHLELATILDSLASIFKNKSNFSKAELFYKRSLELREQVLAPGHQALAFAYDNMASLYTAQGKSELAQPFYKKSLEVTNKTLDFKRPEVFSRLDSLARSYISLGQATEAETLYKQALSLMKENGGSASKDFASASFALANLYMKQAKFGQAEPLLKAALQIFENIHGPQSAALIPVLDSYAESLEKINRGSEALKFKQRSSLIKGNSTACKNMTNLAQKQNAAIFGGETAATF